MAIEKLISEQGASEELLKPSLGDPTRWEDDITELSAYNLNRNSDAIDALNRALENNRRMINRIIRGGVSAVQICVWKDDAE